MLKPYCADETPDWAGGIYLDTDVIPLQSMDRLLKFRSVFGEQAPSPPTPTENFEPDKKWFCNGAYSLGMCRVVNSLLSSLGVLGL
jgi:hypothetical protein